MKRLVLDAGPLIALFSIKDNLACQMPQWKGSLEDASVVITDKQYSASVWTLDYRDLSWFKDLELWIPN